MPTTIIAAVLLTSLAVCILSFASACTSIQYDPYLSHDKVWMALEYVRAVLSIVLCFFIPIALILLRGLIVN